MGDFRVNLGRPHALMSQQFADGLDRHPLRKRNRRGERMTRGVKCDPPGNAGHRHQPFETGIAPTVSRQVKYPGVAFRSEIFPDDRMGNPEQPDMNRRSGLLTKRVDPQLVMLFLDMPGRQLAKVDIREAREATEQKSIPDQLEHRRCGCQPDNTPEFRCGEIIPGNGLVTQLVIGKRIPFHIPLFPGQHENMFEGNHIDPYRILFTIAFQRNITMEIRQEFPVDLLEGDVAASVVFGNEFGKVLIYRSVFAVSRFAARDSDHSEECIVVSAEKLQQEKIPTVISQIPLLDHAGSDHSLFAEQRMVTVFDAIVNPIEMFIDEQGLGTSPDGTPQCSIPKFERDGLLGGNLGAFAVEGDASHDRNVPVAQGCVFFGVEQDFKRVSHTHNLLSISHLKGNV